MAIETHKDPRTQQELMFAVGTIEGIYFNELKSPKTYTTSRGSWTPTHGVNIIIDGTRIGLGLTDKESVNCKDAKGNYHQLARGMKVSAEVEEAGEYKGVKQYNSRASKITVVDASGAQSPNTPQKASNRPSGSFPGGGRDDTQVVAGNARTAAFAFLKGKPYKDVKSINKIVEGMVKLGHTAREQYKAANPSLDDFQVGVSVGQALVLAAGIAKNVKEVESYLQEILNEVIPASVESVKNVRELAKKKAPEPETEPEPEDEEGSEEDWDDPVPF